MSVTVAHQLERAPLGRGSVVLCIPVTAGPELFFRCLGSVIEHSPRDLPVIVAISEQEDPAVERFIDELDREVQLVRADDGGGEVAIVNAALERCGESDVVLLSGHALVFGGWLERLERASCFDAAAATASALGNDAGPLSVLRVNDSLPSAVDLERAASEVARRSPCATPRTPTAEGHCTWLTRAALELVGSFDPAYGSARAALIDFSQRATQRGMVNLVADDLYVPSTLPRSDKPQVPDADRQLLTRRYPYLTELLGSTAEAEHSPLLQATGAARQVLLGMSVTVDARILVGSVSGVQMATLELIEALAGLDGVKLRVLVDPHLGSDARAALDRIPGDIERLRADEVNADTAASAIVHRPYQVTSPDDLDLLMQLGERLVITQLDLIGFHNPGYFSSYETWQHHRRVTRQALTLADRVLFTSDHAAADAVHEGLLDRERGAVVSLASATTGTGEQRRPRQAPSGEFLFSIGNDFLHKNRLFVLKLFAELREIGWDGELVLAGAHVDHGSSAGDEAAYLATHPQLAKFVHELPAVREAEKQWLYANAAAIVYPSIYEGFGLVPFEAQRAGVPCLFASQTSLAELFPAEAAVLVPWNASRSAQSALPLLRPGAARDHHMELLASAASALPGWSEIAASLLEIYEQAAGAPFRESTVLAERAQTREVALADWVIELERDMGRAVGPNSRFPVRAQRAMIAGASRKHARKPMFASLRRFFKLRSR